MCIPTISSSGRGPNSKACRTCSRSNRLPMSCPKMCMGSGCLATCPKSNRLSYAAVQSMPVIVPRGALTLFQKIRPTPLTMAWSSSMGKWSKRSLNAKGKRLKFEFTTLSANNFVIFDCALSEFQLFNYSNHLLIQILFIWSC